MWFFMYLCYLMSVVTFLLLGLAFVQSFTNFLIFNANHLLFMVLTCISYSFTETLVIFFFVGTGVSVRDYTKDHNLSNEFHKRSIAIKRKIYPPLLMNMLYLIILFCLVGAVDTMRIPAWIYQILFAFCIYDYARIKIGQNKYFKDNTEIILDMSGIKS
jgi:hypothetical protein